MKSLHFIFLPFLIINFHLSEADFSCSNSFFSGPFKWSADLKPYDIIISEIMPDPNPVVALPDAEYIELYNRSGRDVNLSGFRIVCGDRIRILPNVTMSARSYVILCDAEAAPLFQLYGKVVPVESMPAILNDGQTLVLKGSSGFVLHTVTFSGEWYETTWKAGGGWSLEMVDDDNPCGQKNNWKESADPKGGTPGARNSVNTYNPDVESPALLRATANSSSSVQLYFNENMDSATIMDRFQYSMNQGFLHPSKVMAVGPDYASVIIGYNQSFDPQKSYTIMMIDSATDCAGNRLPKNAMVDFALPHPFDSLDLIINEVMFEASDQVPEFIEILNRSEKVIDASRLSIGLGDPFNNDIDRLIPLKDHAFLLFPQHYLVITRHPDALPADKKVHWQKNTIGVSALFSMPNDEGVITLMDSASHSIDQMTYSKQFHENLLNETKGVSLERISPDNPSDNRSNWHSAASTENFSTPGYQNSQSILQENVVAEISLLPEIFTPDNDGIDDVVAIHLNTDLAGYFATVIIFNAQGRRIRMLADHDLIGTRDMIIWDGTDLHNLPCETGIYIIYIELFNSSGMVKSVRRTVTLAKILR